MTNRPELNRVNLLPTGTTLVEAARRLAGKGLAIVTMSVGQWDATLAGAYWAGWVLLELDDDERVVATYRRR